MTILTKEEEATEPRMGLLVMERLIADDSRYAHHARADLRYYVSERIEQATRDGRLYLVQRWEDQQRDTGIRTYDSLLRLQAYALVVLARMQDVQCIGDVVYPTAEDTRNNHEIYHTKEWRGEFRVRNQYVPPLHAHITLIECVAFFRHESIREG